MSAEGAGMVRLAWWMMLTLLLGGTAFAQKPEDVLMKADRDFCKDVAAKRLEGWMAWMAPNVVTFGRPGFKGLDEVRKSMKEAFDDADFRLEWEPAKAEMFPSPDATTALTCVSTALSQLLQLTHW